MLLRLNVKAMEMSDSRACPVCGSIVPESTGGRPARYCSPTCRRLAAYELRRVQARLVRLENQAEACRRDRSGLADAHFSSPEQRAADIQAELDRNTARLRELIEGRS